jgi:hypothetical protein
MLPKLQTAIDNSEILVENCKKNGRKTHTNMYLLLKYIRDLKG